MFEFVAIHPDQLLERLLGFDYISFDIFDTLVKRNVASPDDVFDLVQKKYNARAGKQIVGFKQERKAAERRVRTKAEKKEITLDEIYTEISESAETTEALITAEIEAELAVCVPNRPVVAVYQRLLEQGKQLYLVSNMYLPRHIIEMILSKCGIEGYKQLYLSNEADCQKESGLFNKFLESEHLQGKRVIHVGDSFRSDVIAVKKLNLTNFHVCRIRRSIEKQPYPIQSRNGSFSADVVNAVIANHMAGNTERYYRIGFSVYGPLIYSFIQWVVSKLREERIQKVFFLARDAYVLQKAFHMMESADYQDVYFYLSRNSILGTRLEGNYSLENVFATVHKRQSTSLETILRHLKAYTPENAEIAKQLGLNMEMPIQGLPSSHTPLHRYLETVISRKEDEYKHDAAMFEAYLRQYIKPGDKVAIVDVGWNGTAQKAIEIAQRHMGLQASIQGYYIGTNKLNLGREKNLQMSGYLVDEDSSASDRTILKAVMGFLELFLSAPHGTTIGYQEQNGVLIPELQHYELIDSNGNAKSEVKKIADMQAGALDFINQLSKDNLTEAVRLTPGEAISPLRRLCCKPLETDLRLFGDSLFFDANLAYFAKPKQFLYYCRHFAALKKDFGDSTWKIGFMRRLFHNIPLPYYRLYTLLLSFYRK